MIVSVADYAGFCFGVKRAVEKVEELIDNGEKAYMLGPLIHNSQVIERFKKAGINVADLEDIKEGNVIIRTHGVEPGLIAQLNSLNLNIIDCTCPNVKRVHKAVQNFSDKGYFTIIIGEHNHPEVEGIRGWCGKDVKIIENVEEAKNFYTNKKVGIVVQTTQTEENVEKIMEILGKRLDIASFENTRCAATQQRQKAASELAKKVDIMLVVGDKQSANTKNLVKVCQKAGARVYHIQTAADIRKDWFTTADKVGITAGASTPDWIIKEVIFRMDELNKELNNQENQNELAKQEEGETVNYDNTFTDLKEGDIVEGTVVKVDNNEVLVNIGYKSDGIIPVSELSNSAFESAEDVVKVGDKIKALVLKLEDNEGNIILSKKKADEVIGWDELEEIYNNQGEVEGTVTEVVKGGVLVDVKGVKGFIPASHLDLRYVPDLNAFLGQKLNLNIIELDRNKNRLVLSHKHVLEKERDALREETWANIQEGQVIKGVVKRLTDFGAFVDIGGVDGLIHISDLSWQRVNHPSDIVKEGQEVEVVVLKVDKDRQRISLGLKQALSDPWEDIEKKYKVGSVIEGRIAKLVNFGAFVEVEPGVEGLVHISQISNQHVNKPEDVLKEGDIVKVKILEIDPEKKRMSLSIKEAENELNKEESKQSFEKPKDNGITGITIGEMVGDIFENKKE